MTMIEEAGTSRAPRPGAAAAARWWRRPWVLPLAVVAIGFVALSLPRYTTLDPRLSGVPAPEAFP
jgi:hypothetical protein